MKVNARCEHVDGDRRCPDSAGYRVRKPPYQLKPGRFCLRHAHASQDRFEYVVPLAKLPAAAR